MKTITEEVTSALDEVEAVNRVVRAVKKQCPVSAPIAAADFVGDAMHAMESCGYVMPGVVVKALEELRVTAILSRD